MRLSQGAVVSVAMRWGVPQTGVKENYTGSNGFIGVLFLVRVFPNHFVSRIKTIFKPPITQVPWSSFELRFFGAEGMHRKYGIKHYEDTGL